MFDESTVPAWMPRGRNTLDPTTGNVLFEAKTKPAELVDGLVHLVSSPTGSDGEWKPMDGWLAA
jgi:hypothetical protein